MQVKHLLIEKASEYEIKDYKKTIRQLQNLCEEDLGQVVTTVVMNMIENKHFYNAKKVCDKYQANKEGNVLVNISMLKKEIKNAEIGELVLRAINMKATPEQENACFELIEKGLKKGNIKLQSINLGKSKDNLTRITLADVWPDQIEK